MSHSNGLSGRKLRAIFVFGAVFAFGIPPLQAEETTVYQCKDKNGTVIFSSTPCGADAKMRVIDAPNAGTGGDAAHQGIDNLAKQYDDRVEQAQKNAAAAAKARAAAERNQPPVIVQSPVQNDYYYGGYMLPPDRYPGSRPDHHHRPPPPAPSPPVQPYTPSSPGISGRFPGGEPGTRYLQK